MYVFPRAFLEWFFRRSELRSIQGPPERRFGHVEIAAFRGEARAVVSISADLELAWAWRAFSQTAMEARGSSERENVPRIVAMLERHRIPVTWATVGHLFLESCVRDANGHAHATMPRPPRNFGWDGDWYSHDPCGTVANAPGWFCPDLIRLIQRSTVAHELATHSFSHIDFGPDVSDSELVRSEIEACIDAMRPFGAQPRSLVYCFNHMGHQHLPLLASLGITSVRHRDPARRALAYPERTTAGVYKIYESMNLRFGRHYDYVTKADIFLREAQNHHGAFHIWFHPSDPWVVFDQVFEPILATIATYRDRGEVWVATMDELASYCEARMATQLSVQNRCCKTTITLHTTLDEARFGSPCMTLSVPATYDNAHVVVTRNGASMRLPSHAIGRGRRPGTIQFDVSCHATRVEIVSR